MKLTDEQQRFLKEHDVELILREMEVRYHNMDEWEKIFIVFKHSDHYVVDSDGYRWAEVREIEPSKFELTREKVLEWANHEDQQDTFATMEFFAWRIAKQFDYTYDEHYSKFHVRQNGENRPLREVVEEWYRGREK